MHVTALYAAPLTLLYVYLSARVIGRRRALQLDTGDGDDRLTRRLIRGHANFAEFAPLGLLLLAILEIGGRSPWQLHTLGLMLLAGRLAHAWSFSSLDIRMVWRRIGMGLTFAMLGLAAVLCLRQALAI